jgi:hypothetical protein
MLNVENLKTRYVYLILSAVAVIPILLYITTPLFADDFTWFTFLRDNQNKSIGGLMLTETPFGYFRPLAVLIFRALYLISPGNIYIYRLFICILQILITISLYNIFLKLNFTKTVSFWTVFIFSILALHAEVIFLVNCLNILAADFLVLCGIYFFLKREKIVYVLLAIFIFLFSMLCRESSVNYIFLLLVVFFFSGKNNKISFAVVLIVPVILYFFVRYLFAYFNPGIFVNNNFEFSLGILKSVYKVLHYFIISVFPVKSVFYITGFEFYDTLRASFSGKSNPVIFYSLLIFSGIIVAGIMIYVIRKLKKQIIFPVLFFLACLVSYIPSENVSERFAYLASAGICLLIVLVVTQSKKSKIIKIAFILFFVFHFLTLLIRGDSYKSYANTFIPAIEDLRKRLNDDNLPAVVMLENLPAPYRGQMLISTRNFNDTYRYFYPGTKTEFILKNNLSDSDTLKPVNKTFTVDIKTLQFTEIIK